MVYTEYFEVYYVHIIRAKRVSNCYIQEKKNCPSARVHACSTNPGFSVEKIVLVLVWGTSERLVPAKKKKNAWYQRALRCQLRGRPFHPWAGQLRFSGEVHPGPATFTQSSSFSCGAGLQSESRLLLCCAQRAPGTSEKERTPGTSERFVVNCGVGPSTRGQGDSASLVKPTQDQRR